MQQYLVPLFIETEAQIFGPLNLLQFIIIAIAGGVTLILLLITKSIMITFIAAVVLGTPAVFLAFGRINGEKVPKIIALGLKFLVGSKITLWQKPGREEITLKEIKRVIEEKGKITKMKFKESSLKKVIWEVQTGKR